MSETTESTESTQTSVSFFDRPNVNRTTIPVSKGVPFGFEKVSNSALGIGGAYGTWGMSYDNLSLPGLVEHRMGAPLDKSDLMSLGDLGFVSRHHTPDMEDNEHLELETQVGASFAGGRRSQRLEHRRCGGGFDRHERADRHRLRRENCAAGRRL